MSFWAYMLRCSDGKFYVGQTGDLDRRMAEHQAGQVDSFTRDRRPFSLVWSEAFQTRDDARAAEHRIKPWSRAKKEALIAGDWSALSAAAVPPSERAVLASAALGEAPRLRSGHGDADRAPPPPAIILVRPQLAENIGKAARAMLNFGLTELRLVSPRDGWPNPAAGPAASGADSVIAGATLYDSVAAATADCAQVYATTVRKRGVTKPVVTPAEAADAIHVGPGRSAILFGPERAGLETDDVALARTIITVPINPAFGSLNLAQAVILIAYEWSKAEALALPPAVELDPPAPQGELDGMIAQLDAMLEQAGYFFPPDRAPVTRRMLRTLLTKPGWDAQEVRTMRGILSTLDRPRPNRS